MRAPAVAIAAAVLAISCASPTPSIRTLAPTAVHSLEPTSSPPTFSNGDARTPPLPSPNGLRVGVMATVVAGELAQAADPNRPRDQAFQSPLHPGERALRTLGQSAHVMIVGGPTNPNGDVYWQVADDPFPGCCAPFGWVRESQSSTDPAIAVFDVACPDAAVPMNGNQLLALGLMEAESCLGGTDFKLRGDVRCDQPAVDSFVAITGPAWTHDRTLCILDNAVAVYGPSVTSLLDPAHPGYEGVADLTAHFNDPSSDDCRWGPGSLMPIPLDDAPINTAQFACRMSVYVSSTTPES